MYTEKEAEEGKIKRNQSMVIDFFSVIFET